MSELVGPPPLRHPRCHPASEGRPMTASVTTRTTPGWFTADDRRLTDFRAMVETTTDLADYPYADEMRTIVGDGYAGRYVLEQDTVLTERPVGEGPAADVRTSAEHLRALLVRPVLMP